MSKKLIPSVLILIILAVGYYMATIYEPKKNNATEHVDVKDSITIYDISASDIEKISVENETGKYSFQKKDKKWVLSGVESADLSNTAVNSLCYCISSIYAYDIIEENSKNLSLYGIDKPTARIQVDSNEESKLFILGEMVPTGNYYYFYDGSNVYTISKSIGDTFIKTLDSYRNLTVVKLNTEKVRAITISGTGESISVEFSPVKASVENSYGVVSQWKMTAPILWSVDNEKFIKKIVTPACDITAQSVIEDNPVDLSKYNLNKTITIKLDDGIVVYRVGSDSNVNYIYPEGGKAVFSVSDDEISFLNVETIDIIEKLLVLEMLTDINAIDINMQNANGNLSVKHKDNCELYYLDNTISLSEDAFKAMFKEIVGLSADGLGNKNFHRERFLGKIEIFKVDGSIRTIKFYDFDEINAAAEIDGNYVFTIKRTKLSSLENSLNKLKEKTNKNFIIKTEGKL